MTLPGPQSISPTDVHPRVHSVPGPPTMEMDAMSRSAALI